MQRARATVGIVWFAATVRSVRDVELTRHALTTRCDGAGMHGPGDDELWPEVSAPELLVAALAILLAYEIAGCADMRLSRWPDFERWSQVVRTAVVWSGLPDPVMSATTAPALANATNAAIADLVVGWSELSPDFPGGAVRERRLTR